VAVLATSGDNHGRDPLIDFALETPAGRP